MNGKQAAFPGVELNGNGQLYDAYSGMTKREYFALKIMCAYLANPNEAIMHPEDLSRRSIYTADTLLKELDK